MNRPINGAGGTPGGLGAFAAGASMLVAGCYLLLTRVTVTSTMWQFHGYNAFGLSLFPLLIGVGVLFFNGRSLLGWLLTMGGALIIVVGIVANLGVYFQPSSLFDTIMILGLIAGGLGVTARALRTSTPPDGSSGTA